MSDLNINERNKIKRVIILGLIGALVTMLGDFLLMAFNTKGATGMLGSYLFAAKQISYNRIGFAAFFGFIGIPISGLGYLSLCYLAKKEIRQSKLYKLYKYSTIAFSMLGGGVHILCCLILTSLKKNFEMGVSENDVIMAVIKELGGALIPCTLVFLVIFGVMVVCQMILIAKKKTYLSKWYALINPLTLKVLLNISKLLGSSALANGISCSNMSLGCGIILLSWLIAINKMKNERFE